MSELLSRYGGGLFHKHMLAGLEHGDRLSGMYGIRRCNIYRVDIIGVRKCMNAHISVRGINTVPLSKLACALRTA